MIPDLRAAAERELLHLVEQGRRLLTCLDQELDALAAARFLVELARIGADLAGLIDRAEASK
jgi:hypothetical protein